MQVAEETAKVDAPAEATTPEATEEAKVEEVPTVVEPVTEA